MLINIIAAAKFNAIAAAGAVLPPVYVTKLAYPAESWRGQNSMDMIAFRHMFFRIDLQASQLALRERVREVARTNAAHVVPLMSQAVHPKGLVLFLAILQWIASIEPDLLPS
jgi:hypothetical protein